MTMVIYVAINVVAVYILGNILYAIRRFIGKCCVEAYNMSIREGQDPEVIQTLKNLADKFGDD